MLLVTQVASYIRRELREQSLGQAKGLRAENAETPTIHVVYYLVTKLGRLRALHLRKVQPHSDSPRRFMIARSFLYTARIGFRTCIGH